MLSTIALDTQVIQKDLCTGCGACQGMCPYWGSVEGRTICYFDCDRTEGRCQSFCPKMPTDLEALRAKFFEGSEIIPEIGPFRALYLTQAADPEIRKNSQHGGTITALTEFALKEGFIDSCVMTKSEGGLNARGELATTAEEIRACSGSSFQIPPTLAVLNKTLKENKYKKVGVVTTPCKGLAVYKMKNKPLPEKDNNADNIGIVFGVFCGWGLDWNGLEDICGKYSDVTKLSHMDIPPSKYHRMDLVADGQEIHVDLDEVEAQVRPACHYCTDMTCEFADISVGGARSADGWDVDKSWNQLIVRSAKGEELVKFAIEKGVLNVKEVPETALEKLKKAAAGKRSKAVAKAAEDK